MGLCLCIAHVYLDRIVLVLVSIYMNMNVWSCVVLMCYVKGLFTSMYTHKNMYDGLLTRGALRGVPKNTLN